MFRRILAIVLTLVAMLAAGWLALRRSDVPYDTLENAYALPSSHFMTLGDEVKIHYIDSGPRDAPVLLLVHGFAASVHTWMGWQARLDDSYRIIALDLPGHGLSRVPEEHGVSIDYYVDTLEAFADKLDLDSFSLAGSSMGGNVAWNYALEHPARLDGLVLVDASGWAMSGEDRRNSPLVFKLLRVPFVRTAIKDLDLSALIQSGLEKSFADPSFVTPEMTERYKALSRAPGHRGALLDMAGGSKRERASRETLAAISVPTLILWGEQDNLVPVSHAGRFEEAIPNAVAIVYEDAGHIPQEEVAGDSAADVRAFLDLHAAGVGAPASETTPVVEAGAKGAAPGGQLRPR